MKKIIGWQTYPMSKNLTGSNRIQFPRASFKLQRVRRRLEYWKMFAQTDFVKKILTSTLLSIFKIFSKISKVADFFVDGHFDFHDKLWKSSSGIINESRWHVTRDYDWRTYPVLLDRVAYIKNWFPKFRRLC